MIPRANLSYLDYLDWKKLNKVFSSLDVYTGTGYLLNTPTGVEPVPAARVSDGFFRTLGVTPAFGRDFYAGEDKPGAASTVMLSYATWQTRFGGRKDVIGQTVTLNGIPNTVIGVLPQGFQFAPRGRAEFWTTLHDPSSCEKRRSCHNLYGIGRLTTRSASGLTARSNAGQNPLASTTTCRGPGNCRIHARNAPASLTTCPCR